MQKSVKGVLGLIGIFTKQGCILSPELTITIEISAELVIYINTF